MCLNVKSILLFDKQVSRLDFIALFNNKEIIVSISVEINNSCNEICQLIPKTQTRFKLPFVTTNDLCRAIFTIVIYYTNGFLFL